MRFQLSPGELAKRFLVKVGVRDKDPVGPAGISSGPVDSFSTNRNTRQPSSSERFSSTITTPNKKIQITAFWENTVVAEASIQQGSLQIVDINLEFDAISAIEISSGPGVLIDICWERIDLRGEELEGWQALPDFPYPLCLPVTHPDYPCGGTKSTGPGSLDSLSLATATPSDQQTALNRILYGSPTDWDGQAFQDLKEQLSQLVDGGPGSQPMAERIWNQGEDVIGEADPPDSDTMSPKMPNQRPLDLVLLASLHPAVAQMLGLYWVDQTAEPGVAYDYMLLADHSGHLTWLRDLINSNSNTQSSLDLDKLKSDDFDFTQSTSPSSELGATQSDILDIDAIRTAIRSDQPNLERFLPSSKTLETFRNATLSAELDSGSSPTTASIADSFKPPTKSPVDIDIYIHYNVSRELAPPLPEPDNVRVYALPGGTIPQPGGGILDATNNTGITWNLGLNQKGELDLDKSVMYHLWRADLGIKTPASMSQTSVPITVALEPRTLPPHQRRPKPIVVPGKEEPGFASQPAGEDNKPKPPSNWPSFPLHAIDQGLAEGWYSYQVSGIDIFGRHSSNSEPATWHQWTPAPQPKPWYYQDSTINGVVHDSAVHLLDKIPPPPPTAIEAYALDPADPHVLKDAAYHAWRETLSSTERETLIGMRVRWQWRMSHFLQAPDTREFRIYYQADRLNAQVGQIVSVTATGDEQSIVNTNLTNTLAANAYTGAYLVVEPDSFSILESEAGSPLVLQVKNIGPSDKIRPQSKNPCTVSIPPDHDEFVDYTESSAWQQRYYVVSYDQHFREMIPAQRDSDNYELVGNFATASEAVVSLENNDPNLNDPNLADVKANFNVLYLENDTARPSKLYQILAVNDEEKTLTLDGAPDLGDEPSAWIIGIPEPLRQYEVFLPASEDTYRESLPLAVSLANPVVYAQIGISVADDKTHTLDDEQWLSGQWGGPERYGNEGAVGQPATIFRVLRDKPDRPVPPPDSDRVFATPADYHSHSFYTYRWSPSDYLKTHILRALDDSLFQVDWSLRSRPPEIDMDFFPDQAMDIRWDALKREQVTVELDQLNQLNSDDKAAAMAVYRSLSNDALRVLAGLPGNERAFTQITILPLDPEDATNDNRVGPDNPAGFEVDEDLRAYIDQLDGRSTNRYFYRAAYVDGANNRSDLSLSSPPVWMSDVVPPAKPQLLKVLGGEHRITLRWRAHSESGMRRYQIYRSEIKEHGRDIRLMGEPVADLPATPLVVQGGVVDLGGDADIDIAERVYAVDGFNPSLDLLSGQNAIQFLDAPEPVNDTDVIGLTVSDGALVVVVYRDSKGGLQYTAWGNSPRVWIDETLVGARNYYYRIVASREGEAANGGVILESLQSDLGAGRAFDLEPPLPPTITMHEWVRVGDDETVFPFNDPIPEGESRVPGVRLVWSSPNPELRCLVQYIFNALDEYDNASPWLTRGEYEYVHKNEFPFHEHEYRVKVVNEAGNMNSTFAPVVIPAAPFE